MKIIFYFTAIVASMNLSADDANHSVYSREITNVILNQLIEDNKLSGTSEVTIDEIRNQLEERVGGNLALAASGLLSLDADSPDYFLGFIGDAIGSVVGTITNIAGKAFRALKGVGSKMFSAVKGGFSYVSKNIGTIAKSSVSFIANVTNSEMVKEVVGWGSQILLKGATLAAPLTAAIPGVGPGVAVGLTSALSFANTIVTKDNVGKAMDIIGAVSGSLNTLIGASVAPNAQFNLDSLSEKGKTKPPKGSVESVMKVCANFLKYIEKKRDEISTEEAKHIKTCTTMADRVANNMK